MINPSAPGWIEKYFFKYRASRERALLNTPEFYLKIRKTGFIYGHIISVASPFTIGTKNWLPEETSKVSLLNNLYLLHRSITSASGQDEFIISVLAFYHQMNPQAPTLLNKVLQKSGPASRLEQIIAARVQTNHDFVSKNFTHLVTNALLFVDVLAYNRFLKEGHIPANYLKKVEESIIILISLALRAKSVKSSHDDMLIKLVEASARYSKFAKGKTIGPGALQTEYFTEELEKFYLIDLAAITLWRDGEIDNEEKFFLFRLAEVMNVEDTFINQSISETDGFINKHKKDISYFNHTNPVKNFYDHISQNVAILITRNKKRLLKELSQSKELVLLLAQSTHRDLDAKEKKKVKNQILEICKTIPSLTIFLLPGGSLLLPVLIKFIPQLLPSAFNDNDLSE